MCLRHLCLTLLIIQSIKAKDPFVPEATATRDGGVVCDTSDAIDNFNKCLNQHPNFKSGVARCGGSSALLGLFPISGTYKSVCANPHKILNCMATSVSLESEADRQQCLDFHACIRRPIDMPRILAFREKVAEYKRSG